MSLADIQSMKALKMAKQNTQTVFDAATIPMNEIWSLGYFYRSGSTYTIVPNFNAPNYSYVKFNNLKVGDAYFINLQSVAGFTSILTLDVNNNVLRSLISDSTSKAYTNYEVVILTNEVSIIIQSMSRGTDAPHGVKRGTQSNVKNLHGTGKITCGGDSLTYGAGVNRSTQSYPAVLATLTGINVNNFAVGGEGKEQIASRMGANPFVVAPFTIPADTTTAVNISLSNYSGVSMTTESQGAYFESGINPCFIGGVQGTIKYDSINNVNTFTRTTAGTSVSLTRPTMVMTDWMKNHLSDITIIWSGTNGTKTISDVPDLISYIRTMVESLTHNKYIVIGLQAISSPNYVGTSSDMVTINKALAKEFGKHFLDIYTYMINYGLQDAGLTATSQDTTDLSNGIIPTSLRYDAVHFNTYGYQIVAQQVKQRLADLGYIN